jgi:hypothetical protein
MKRVLLIAAFVLPLAACQNRAHTSAPRPSYAYGYGYPWQGYQQPYNPQSSYQPYQPTTRPYWGKYGY